MRSFWLTHAALPATACALLAVAILVTQFDMRVADALFFAWDEGRWIGAQAWWATAFLHTGGRNFVRLIAFAALLAFALSFAGKRWRHWRRGAAYVALAILLSSGLAGLLKSISNVDCPWDLERYGGRRPYIGLFGDRPDELPRARCFPGAHSSSGFALMCFYFLLRNRRRRAAQLALGGGLLLGLAFALGQEARGAHFLSHDLTSAAIVWYVLLGLYVTMLRPQAVHGD